MISGARRRLVARGSLISALVIPGAANAATMLQPENQKGETPTMAPPQEEPPGEPQPPIAPSAVTPPGAASPAAAPPSVEQQRWAFDASAFLFITPGATYLSPVLTADYGRLHLEGRYNYEGQKTASTWVGYNLRVGDVVTLKATPMVAAVFGAANGVSPGCRASVVWQWLELYAEGEDVFFFGEDTTSFVYVWSTLTASPLEWLHFGLAAQRTRLYQTELGIQRGFLLGFSIEHVALTGYLFNPDLPTPTYVVALDVKW